MSAPEEPQPEDVVIEVGRTEGEASAPEACCELHNANCEPPGDLCCYDCGEANHPHHPPGELCVMTIGHKPHCDVFAPVPALRPFGWDCTCREENDA